MGYWKHSNIVTVVDWCAVASRRYGRRRPRSASLYNAFVNARARRRNGNRGYFSDGVGREMSITVHDYPV